MHLSCLGRASTRGSIDHGYSLLTRNWWEKTLGKSGGYQEIWDSAFSAGMKCRRMSSQGRAWRAESKEPNITGTKELLYRSLGKKRATQRSTGMPCKTVLHGMVWPSIEDISRDHSLGGFTDTWFWLRCTTCCCELMAVIRSPILGLWCGCESCGMLTPYISSSLFGMDILAWTDEEDGNYWRLLQCYWKTSN